MVAQFSWSALLPQASEGQSLWSEPLGLQASTGVTRGLRAGAPMHLPSDPSFQRCGSSRIYVL